MKRIMAMILAVWMLGAFVTGCKSEERIQNEIASVERYQYPINIDSEDWFDYTVQEKTNMLRIPQEILEDLSDLQLLFAIGDYPYFVSVYGFDEAHFSTFSSYCSAFEELLSRKSFLKSLETYGEAVAREYLADQTDILNFTRADMILSLVEVYTGSRPDVSDLLKAWAELDTN